MVRRRESVRGGRVCRSDLPEFLEVFCFPRQGTFVLLKRRNRFRFFSSRSGGFR